LERDKDIEVLIVKAKTQAVSVFEWPNEVNESLATPKFYKLIYINEMNKIKNRRSFLIKATLGAGALLVKNKSIFGASADQAQTAFEVNNADNSFVSLQAEELKDLVKSLQGKSGVKEIVKSEGLPFTVRAISEKQMLAKEFEIHEFRDHVVQVLAGSTHFDVGGDTESPRIIGTGEQLALNVNGSKSVTMNIGDMLVIPRGTPHKRSTIKNAVLLMISVAAPNPITKK